MPRAIALPLTWITFVAFLGGCTSMQRAARTRELLDQAVEAKVYDQGLDQLWPGVREFVFLQGYQTKSGDDSAGYAIETEWRNEEGRSTRLLVQGQVVDDGHSTVRFARVTRSRVGTELRESTGTAPDLAWKLWEHIDPDGAEARRAEAEATAAAEVL
jgi:hypothetical protein